MFSHRSITTDLLQRLNLFQGKITITTTGMVDQVQLLDLVPDLTAIRGRRKRKNQNLWMMMRFHLSYNGKPQN